MSEYVSQGMEYVLAEQQLPLMDLETEVLDSLPDVSTYLESTVVPFIRDHDDIVTEIRLIAETGSIKGTLGGQILVRLLTDLPLEGHLEAMGKSLQPWYVSTKMILDEGQETGKILNPPGARTAEEYTAATQSAADVVLAAKRTLPDLEPDKVHVIFEELIGQAGHINFGREIIAEKEEPRSPTHGADAESQEALNSRFNIISVTDDEIRRRAYRLRVALERQRAAGISGGEAIAAEHNTSFDMSPIDALDTFGPSRSMALFSSMMNKDMLEAFKQGRLVLPEETPEELLESYDLGERKGAALDRFFLNLTEFTDDDVTTNPLRPWLQHGFYDYMAREIWKLKSYIIIHPRFLENEIHAYPNLFRQYKLPFARFRELSSEKQSGGEDIFVRDTTTPDHPSTF